MTVSRSFLHRCAIFASFWICGISLGSAHADNVVIESYAGSRPADADSLIGPVRSALVSRGFDAGATLVTRVETQISRAARILSPSDIATARRLVREGRKEYINGGFDAAMKKLSQGRKLLLEASATMARNQRLRAVLRDALVYMALVESQRGASEKARSSMAELVRTFPNTPINVARYGPQARTLFLAVKRSLTNQGLGTLSVNVDDPTAVSFLNERYVGGGTIRIPGLHAGRYRLYVQRGEANGRVRHVHVAAGGSVTVDVAWKIDGSLRTAGSYVGVEFSDTAAQRRDEASTVIRVARSVGASGAAVVRITSDGGQRTVSGAYYTLDSNKPIRTASIDVDPVKPDAGKLRVLGRFLSGDEEAAKQIAKIGGRRGNGGDGAGGGAGPGARDVARPYKTWKWVTLIGGVAALAGGVTLIAIHEPEFKGDVRNEYAKNTRTPGIIATAVGGVLTITGGYLWLRDRKDARRGGVAVVPTAGGAMMTLGGRF